MRSHLPRIGDQGMLVALVWLASRLMMTLVGAVLLRANPSWSFVQLVGRWDVAHFTDIAKNGYGYDPTAPAFFPGLPLLLRAGAAIGVPMETFGVVIALIGSALATAALYRLFGAPAACLWLIAPTAIFTMVGYSEAPFCAAAFWAWYHAKRNHWGWAGLLAGLACAFRISGVFLLAGLGIWALLKHGWANRLRALAWLLVPLAVLGGFEFFLHGLTGSWTAWIQAQQAGWTRGFCAPWTSLWHTIQAGTVSQWPGRTEVAWVFRAEVVSMVIGLATTIWCLVRKRWAWAVYIGLQVIAFGTSYWFMSVNRAILVWFPLWAGLGAAITWRPANQSRLVVWRLVQVVAVAASLAMMLTWAWLFLTGLWAS